MSDQHRRGLVVNGGGNLSRVNVPVVGIDIDEHRYPTGGNHHIDHIVNRIGRQNDLAPPRTLDQGLEREVDANPCLRHRHGMARAGQMADFLLESGDIIAGMYVAQRQVVQRTPEIFGHAIHFKPRPRCHDASPRRSSARGRRAD